MQDALKIQSVSSIQMIKGKQFYILLLPFSFVLLLCCAPHRLIQKCVMVFLLIESRKWFTVSGRQKLCHPLPSVKVEHRWIQIMFKSSGGKRPKKKTYYRVNDLDRVMELQKKPSLILRLKSIIQSQRKQCVLLRDLEKEVGFVQKWNFMGVIEKYPSIFRVTGSNRTPPTVMLTEKADKVALEEDEARVQMEPILVKNLRKLLMLSVDCALPLETIQLIENDLGLPSDFRQSLIPKYPQFFSVKDVNGRTSLQLENWDSFLAVTAREERLACEGVLNSKEKARVLKDGNYFGPFAFQMRYPAGFRPNMNYLKEVQKWQKMEFPSPYMNAKRFELADPKAQKRVVAVLHELLSLTMEKRLTSAQIDAFHSELRLPARLLLCLTKHHGIFYITNKGVRSTVILKEAYDGSNLICKCPLLLFRDKFIALTGRRVIDSCIRAPT
ncbi:protein WHAT'S THIS FACTOR 1 homolog, chloroplastic [Solanum stenotomum]|uniref:protein WHAT'S THIS FACTOR 1 homolog, chloroplastic n=1 Tax=Solanum stenotomum TaxID=172797 RepID=UPI0020D119B1|nr:protein WHAT'S THIS FACTOR 1 homolog, chloroplastic [Solanum stenotomum]